MEDTFNNPSGNGEMNKKGAFQGLTPKEFIFKYLKYLPWVLVCVAVACAIAYVKIRYAPSIYHMQSTLLIEDQSPAGGSKDQRFQDMFIDQGQANLKNEVQILHSSPVIERVVRSLDLQTRYYIIGAIRTTQLYPSSPLRLVIEHMVDSTEGISLPITVKSNTSFVIGKGTTPYSFGQSFDFGGNRLTVLRNNDADLKDFPSPQFLITWLPAYFVAGSLMGSLKIVAPEDGTTILALSFDGENTALGLNTLNKLMAVYDSLKIEDKNRISANTLRFIDDQLDILKSQLGSVEGKTKGFMVQNDAVDIGEQSKLYMGNIAEINKQAIQQQVKVSVIDLLINYISDEKNRNKLVPSNLGVEEPAVTQFVTEYNRLELQREANIKTTKPDNPMIRDMDVTLENMRNNMLQVLQNVKKSYEIAISSLEDQTRLNQGHLRAIPDKTMQLMNIDRQRKILEDLYSFLLQKKLETAISSAATISNSKVIEPAAASYEAISPNKKNIYLFHIMLGILIPVGVVALMEIMKDKVSNRADIERNTRAPILGEIGHSEGDQTLVVAVNSRRFVAEQFRIIRSNLQYIIGKKEKPVIMVTSSFSGEGKSFVSTNIGAVMALAGKKTVIMEYDIRKPKIVSGLELKRKMGITNYIIGKASFEELILPVQEVENLFVIPCGPIPPNPAELLLDPKLDELMEQVKRHFEVVIMDTAPVGLVSDAINLGKYVDCSLYIVRQGHTFRNQLKLIEELYTEKKLPNISVVINDVKPEGGYYSGYGYYGGYGYYANSYNSRSGYFEKEHRAKKGIFGKLFAKRN